MFGLVLQALASASYGFVPGPSIKSRPVLTVSQLFKE